MRSDHPRACGANGWLPIENRYNAGSSPRVRGKRRDVFVFACQMRIIPARAGQTMCLWVTRYVTPDHPRACGANSVAIQLYHCNVGSSPRVRGKRFDGLDGETVHRIIPARAGQTRRRCSRVYRRSDHPRACGANFRHAIIGLHHVGSSPRVRGKQSDFMRKLLSAGPSIIGFAQWLQSSCYCSCFQSSAKTPISRGTTPTSLFLGFQNSITLLLLT